MSTTPTKIQVACPQCGSAFRVMASDVGRKGRCNRCAHIFRIPAPNAPRQTMPGEPPFDARSPRDPAADSPASESKSGESKSGESKSGESKSDAAAAADGVEATLETYEGPGFLSELSAEQLRDLQAGMDEAGAARRSVSVDRHPLAGESAASEKTSLTSGEKTSLTSSEKSSVKGSSAEKTLAKSPPGPKDSGGHVLHPDEEEDDDENIPTFPIVTPPPPSEVAAGSGIRSDVTGPPADMGSETGPPPIPPVVAGGKDPGRRHQSRVRPPASVPMLVLMGAAGLAAVATLAVLLIIFLPRTEVPVAPPVGGLVIEWPVSERAGGSLLIDKERLKLALSGHLQFDLPPGEHDVILQRPGFFPHEEQVFLENDKVTTLRPEWYVVDAVPPMTEEYFPPSETTSTPAEVTGFEGWTRDLAAAKAQAAEQNKGLFVVFVDDDSLAIAKARILDNPELSEPIAAEYVLTLLRLANDTPEAKVNRELHAAVGFEDDGRVGISIAITDAEGKPFAVAESYESVEAWLTSWRKAREERDRVFAAVDELEGAEKLSAILSANLWIGKNLFDRAYIDKHQEWYRLAEEIDPENKAGFLEHAFASYWSARLLLAMQVDQEQFPRLLYELKKWQEKHAFSDQNRAAEVLLYAAEAMLEMNNVERAKEYLKEVEASPPGNDVLRTKLLEVQVKTAEKERTAGK
ncbi:zinc-ribbon domain-containing protein [Lignipirellula cremea]|uniref:Zinc finger/thioredoxin putative domain-containing protein n=1 Tax=Lignipirellula cremea TaxID=2528010 RepID=A0A518DNT8_9BACT|nr:zinc-ribbon domain-containing protein [Lignipirellula cremea]QDU93500.1 hypothetical protein Pla8534_12800 [Lignipirellula cremea]